MWGGTYSTHSEPLIVLQKKLIRIIHGKLYLCPTDELFYESKLPKFPDIYLLNLGIFMYLNCDEPTFQRNIVYNTRQSHHLNPSYQRLELTQRSVTCRGPNFWNSLTVELQNSSSLPVFKRNLKRDLISKYLRLISLIFCVLFGNFM